MKTKHPLHFPPWWDKIPIAERMKGRCGAGDGLGEKIVPDSILGLNITPACAVHDKDWSPEWNPNILAALQLSEAEKNHKLLEIFHNSNWWLHENILIIINNESANWFMIYIRSKLAYKYYTATELARNIFWEQIENYNIR